MELTVTYCTIAPPTRSPDSPAKLVHRSMDKDVNVDAPFSPTSVLDTNSCAKPKLESGSLNPISCLQHDSTSTLATTFAESDHDDGSQDACDYGSLHCSGAPLLDMDTISGSGAYLRPSRRHCDGLVHHCILGDGNFGQVWLVSKEVGGAGMRCPYALKMVNAVDPVHRSFALYEGAMMKQLAHPFICKLFTVIESHDHVSLLQAFCHGGELFAHIHRHPHGLPESYAQFYAACLADALAYMHRHNVAYLDLKPENVMLDMLGYPILIDFNYARHLGDGELAYTMCGTPHFMAPEIIEGRGHDGRADWWALGILVYEMLTRRHPFDTKEHQSTERPEHERLFAAIAEQEYVPNVFMSPDANDIVAHLLVKDMCSRWSVRDIMQHDWMACCDVDRLRAQAVPAPWRPALQHMFDTRYF